MAEDFRFQIRHGSPLKEGEEGIPAGSLKPYELGWAYNNGLYMGYTKTDGTTGIFRIVPYGLNSFYKKIIEEGYLPLTGGTIDGDLTVTGNLSLVKSVNGGYIGLKDLTNIECRVAISSSTSGKGRHGLWSSGYSSDATAEKYETSNVWIIYRDRDGKVVLPTQTLLSGYLGLGSSNYGTALPTSNLYAGRIFFLKES